jgi:hypothetical protein
MAEQQKTPEQEAQRRIIRRVAIVVIGTVAVLMFQYMAQGLAEIYAEPIVAAEP